MAYFTWVPPEDRIQIPWIGNAAFLAICYLGPALVSAFRPSTTRTVVSLAFIIWFTYMCFFINIDVSFWEGAGLLTDWPNNVIMYCERFLYGKQETEPWQRVKDKPKAEIEKRQTPKTFWKRLVWGVEIACNPRGVGWSQQFRNLPESPPRGTTKWQYLSRKVPYMCLQFFVMTQLNIVGSHLVAGGRYLDDGMGPIVCSFYTLPLWQRVLALWLQVTRLYLMIAVVGSLIPVLGVIVNAYSPDECPPVNGPLSEAYTMRKYWGVFWHQNMRRSAAFSGQLLVNDILGLRKGSFSSRYLQLFTGFYVTAAIHVFATWAILGYSIGEWIFYPAQALGIFIEDQAMELGKSLGAKPSRFWRYVGHVWVVFWFTLCFFSLGGGLITHGALLFNTPPDVFGLDAWLRKNDIFEYQMS